MVRYCRVHHNATGVVIKVPPEAAPTWATFPRGKKFTPLDDVAEYEADPASFHVHKFSFYRANSLYREICQIQDFKSGTVKPVGSSHSVSRDGTPYVMEFKEARKRSDDIQVYVDVRTLLKHLRAAPDPTVGAPEPKKGYNHHVII
jgi:hypothetical protein